jgi:hypothetical protein
MHYKLDHLQNADEPHTLTATVYREGVDLERGLKLQIDDQGKIIITGVGVKRLNVEAISENQMSVQIVAPSFA